MGNYILRRYVHSKTWMFLLFSIDQLIHYYIAVLLYSMWTAWEGTLKWTKCGNSLHIVVLFFLFLCHESELCNSRLFYDVLPCFFLSVIKSVRPGFCFKASYFLSHSGTKWEQSSNCIVTMCGWERGIFQEGKGLKASTETQHTLSLSLFLCYQFLFLSLHQWRFFPCSRK